MTSVVDDLIAAVDYSELLVMSMLRGEDLRNALDDGIAPPSRAGPAGGAVRAA